jgi:hypothetical protein
MGTNSPKSLAVMVAAILHWLLGAVWFTLLKQQWLAGLGTTSDKLMAAGIPVWLPHVVTLIANLLLAYVIGWVILATGSQTLVRGIGVAVFLWLVVASVFATELVFEAKSLEFFCIVAGYPLVGMMIMGAVLGAWKK